MHPGEREEETLGPGAGVDLGGRVLCGNNDRSGNVLSHSREHHGCGYRVLKNSAEFASVRGFYNALCWCVVRLRVLGSG